MKPLTKLEHTFKAEPAAGSCALGISFLVHFFMSGISAPITLWLFNVAMENGPLIDGLPIKNGDFPWLC